ncbi:MAG: hypothetical protein U0165_07990 [Polyangiaceae bacterium]
MGQEQPIDVFNLIAEPGLESRIATLVGAKKALFNGVFDSSTNEVRFDATGSFVAEVRRLFDAPIPAAPVVDIESDPSGIDNQDSSPATLSDTLPDPQPNEDEAEASRPNDPSTPEAVPTLTQEAAHVPRDKAPQDTHAFDPVRSLPELLAGLSERDPRRLSSNRSSS